MEADKQVMNIQLKNTEISQGLDCFCLETKDGQSVDPKEKMLDDEKGQETIVTASKSDHADRIRHSIK
jgi:hypothetical protein